MRVGISVDALSPQLTGIGRYTWELCQGLGQDPRITHTRFFRHPDWIADPSTLLNPAGRRRRRRLLPKPVRRWNANRQFRDLLFHGTNFFLPEQADSGIVTVHDLSVFLYPETHPEERIRQFEKSFRHTLDRAQHIITDSEAVRTEVVSHFGVGPEHVTAVGLGVSVGLFRGDREDCRDLVKRTLGRDVSEFVLSVATFEPRKRLESAIRAHAMFCDNTNTAMPLVLVGADGWHNEGLHEIINAERAKGRLITVGYVTEAQLSALYAASSLFLYPSIYEGFGLPPIEAMANGVPVIVSDRSCLPEVTGGKACYIDPDDIEAFSRAIEFCLTDSTWRMKAIEGGLEVAARYTWDNCVSETVSVYQRVLGL